MEYSNNKKVLNSDLNKICALPDSVLYTILSFLDMTEVMGTSLVSRRWRYLWASVPVLNFDYDTWENVHMNKGEKFCEDEEKKRKEEKKKKFCKEGFMNFVDQVLFLRDGSEVNKFQIFSSIFCDSDRVVAWLTVAARRQFQKIHLGICPVKPIELPHLLFTSAITLFKLEAVGDIACEYPPIKVPNSVSSSPQLKTLILDWFQFPKGNSNGEFILSCPVLENLTLIDCDQRHLNALILSAPQLKNLVITNNDRDWVGPCHIKIWTPNLILLSCIGFWYNKYSITNYSSLVYAKIDFSHEQPDTHNLVEFLGAVTCATTIKLFFVDSISKLDNLTNQFSNLRLLRLVISGDKKLCISVVLQLLKNAPCIETLYLDAQELEDCEEEVVPFKCSHLKYARIGRLKGCEVKFLKFLLKNAVVLEKLRIRMCVNSSVSVKENLGEKMLSLPRTSTSTIVVLL